MLPESSQKKINEAVVIACGPGATDSDGDVSYCLYTCLSVRMFSCTLVCN